MTARSCRVTMQNSDGVSHSADVTAGSVYEAVAQGLVAFRKCDWAEGALETHGTVTVSVAEVRVDHHVRIADFTKWLERPGRTPREVSERHRIRSILGLPTSVGR
jgi:hypothetical protein